MRPLPPVDGVIRGQSGHSWLDYVLRVVISNAIPKVTLADDPNWHTSSSFFCPLQWQLI